MGCSSRVSYPHPIHPHFENCLYSMILCPFIFITGLNDHVLCSSSALFSPCPFTPPHLLTPDSKIGVNSLLLSPFYFCIWFRNPMLLQTFVHLTLSSPLSIPPLCFRCDVFSYCFIPQCLEDDQLLQVSGYSILKLLLVISCHVCTKCIVILWSLFIMMTMARCLVSVWYGNSAVQCWTVINIGQFSIFHQPGLRH